jgi:hypothetical protein
MSGERSALARRRAARGRAAASDPGAPRVRRPQPRRSTLGRPPRRRDPTAAPHVRARASPRRACPPRPRRTRSRSTSTCRAARAQVIAHPTAAIPTPTPPAATPRRGPTPSKQQRVRCARPGRAQRARRPSLLCPLPPLFLPPQCKTSRSSRSATGGRSSSTRPQVRRAAAARAIAGQPGGAAMPGRPPLAPLPHPPNCGSRLAPRIDHAAPCSRAPPLPSPPRRLRRGQARQPGGGDAHVGHGEPRRAPPPAPPPELPVCAAAGALPARRAAAPACLQGRILTQRALLPAPATQRVNLHKLETSTLKRYRRAYKLVSCWPGRAPARVLAARAAGRSTMRPRCRSYTHPPTHPPPCAVHRGPHVL